MKLHQKIQTIRHLRQDWKFIRPTKDRIFQEHQSSILPSIEQKNQELIRKQIFETDSSEQQTQLASTKPIIQVSNLSYPKKKTSTSPRIRRQKYQNPWYIPPKKWNKYSQAPETIRAYDSKRAKNLYYHLHDPKPVQNVTGTRVLTALDQQVVRMQQRIQMLPIIDKYKNYLEKNNFRLPRFLQDVSGDVSTA